MSKREVKQKFWKNKKKLIILILAVWFISVLAFNLIENARFSNADKIAIIPIKGVLGTSSNFMPQESLDSSEIIAQLETIQDDPTVKAVILEIDSPGGAVIASKEIAKSVASLDKPTIAWIREVGASGAYWIAASSDYIVADELSVTGSIGVIGSYLQFKELFEDYGITYERLVSGDKKDAGSPFKELTKSERELIQSKLDMIHEVFIKDIAKNRNMSIEEVRKLADGSFYLGLEAKDSGLVDALGGKKEAFEIAENLANVEEYEIVVYEPQKGLLDLLQSISAKSFYFLGKGIGTSLVENTRIQTISSL